MWDETSWIIEYGIKDFIPGAGEIINTSVTPYTLENLTSQTEYAVYIKADCGAEQSSSLYPDSFTTSTTNCSGDRFYTSGVA